MEETGLAACVTNMGSTHLPPLCPFMARQTIPTQRDWIVNSGASAHTCCEWNQFILYWVLWPPHLLSLHKWQTISALDAGDTLNWVSMPLIAGDRTPHETFTKWKQSVKMLERRAPGDVPNVNSPGDNSRMPSLLKFLFCHYHFLHSLVPSLFVCQASLCKHGGFFIHSRILFTSVFEDETLR